MDSLNAKNWQVGHSQKYLEIIRFFVNKLNKINIINIVQNLNRFPHKKSLCPIFASISTNKSSPFIWDEVKFVSIL